MELEPGFATGLLLNTAGRVTAMEFVLKVLIASHPDREKLAALWREKVLDFSDAGMEHPVYSKIPAFHDAPQSQLQRLAQLLFDPSSPPA